MLTVKVGDDLITRQEEKEASFHEAYQRLLGTIQNRQYTLDLDELGIQALDLSDLETIFSEEEVWAVIRELPPDRAPGPDGFTSAFYHKAWHIIKRDMMAAILKLYVGDGRGFGKLNRDLITRIPKKNDA